MSAKETLVLGVGNLLLGDEGVGVHAIRALEETELPPHVERLDGGTGGFHLLGCFGRYDPLVIVDATMDGRPPGTVTLLRPRFASDFPRVLTAHDIGLRDLVETAFVLGTVPEMFLVTISIAPEQPLGVTLSPTVEAALPEVVDQVRRIVTRLVPEGADRA